MMMQDDANTNTIIESNSVIDADGTLLTHSIYDNGEEWWQRQDNGQLHRGGDEPAIVRSNGSDSLKEWYRDGKLHRDGGPALVRPDEEHWVQNGKTHRDDGPAIITDNRIFHWVLNDKYLPFDAWAYRAGLNPVTREELRRQYNEPDLNKHEKYFFSEKYKESRFNYFGLKRKKIHYEKILEVLSHDSSIELKETKQIVSQIDKQVKEKGLSKHITVENLVRKKDGNADLSYPDTSGRLAITIKNLEIYMRGYNPNLQDENILTKRVENDLDGNFQIKFVSNKFIGGQQKMHAGGDAQSIWLGIRVQSIELVRNEFHGSSLLLFGSTVRMIKNKYFPIQKNDSISTHIHCFPEGGAENSCDARLIGNKFGPVSISSKGRIDIGGKTSVEYFINPQVRFATDECYIGHKFSLGHDEFTLESSRTIFSDLLTKATARSDKRQQKIIESEISRIEYHLHSTMNKDSVGEWFDIFLMWLHYKLKLEFYDRHAWVKWLFAVIAFSVFALLPDIFSIIKYFS